ncbi:MAG: glycosyltransferase family 39 protein, partial [Chitinophagaceae bacterium]|nr:glycosyltransferase family 39 protein [Chitinophagaceae bacterium]
MKLFFNKITRASSLWNMVFLLTMLVYAVGLFIDIMEPDAAVYAEVSMEMHDSGNFLSIFHKHLDWLDKPHFPFWMSALSYKIFGVSTFAYKLPAVVFTLLGAFYTFFFGKRFYSPLHGWIAALILITAQHIIISNQDVRAEPFMTGLVIMGLYHFATYLEMQNFPERSWAWPHAVFGAFALACLIMTKGLFTIIPVAAGVGLTLLFERNWKAIFDWQWLIVGVMIIIFLFPALYGYYLQFDMHPEKEVFGKHGVSGVEFFLWTSQWGRFTNTGPIKGSGDPSFFVHTMLWAFLPWSFAAFYALFQKTKQLIKKTSSSENYTYFGFITLFLIFSASKFQLSFYLNPLFPLLAIITTAALLQNGIKTLKVFSTIHTVLCCLLIAALALLH